MMAKETDYKAVAQQIIEVVGGPENIISVAHCATRLRLIVKNREIIDDKQVEAIDIVKGCFFTAGQYQIILGTGIVNKVYDEVMKLGIEGSSKNEQAAAAAKRGNKLQQLIRVFADVFVPIIPVMVATGLFMGLRGFLTQDALLAFFGTSADAIPKQFLEFTQILTDTAFGFLPVLVCWSAFKKFGGSPVLGIVIGLMLVSSILPTSWDVAQGNAKPLIFFGFIKVNGYQSSVLPAFIVGFLGSKIEQWLHDHVINALDLIVTPFVTVLVSLCLGLFVVGPIFHSVEVGLVSIVAALFSLPFGIGGFIWGALCQVIVVTGVHHALNLVEIEMLAKTKWKSGKPGRFLRYCSTGRSSNGSCSKNKINKNEILRLSFCNLCITWNYRACSIWCKLKTGTAFCMCMYRWWRRRMDRSTSRTERNRNVYHWYSGNALISE